MNTNSIIILPRWTSQSDRTTDDLFFIQDNTHTSEGWWVLMREDCGSMILFTGLRKEIAEDFKVRLDMSLKQYMEKRGR